MVKKYEFLNNTVRFGDMLVVNKRDGVQQGFRIITKSIKFLSGNFLVYYIVVIYDKELYFLLAQHQKNQLSLRILSIIFLKTLMLVAALSFLTRQ